MILFIETAIIEREREDDKTGIILTDISTPFPEETYCRYSRVSGSIPDGVTGMFQ
jgi:hypothetical protein